MKNPLRKRLLRELKNEFGKYLVIFLFMMASIGFVSGFLVADGSMIIAYNESFEKYNIEDGNFRISEKLSKVQRNNIEESGVTIYDNYYVEKQLTNDSTLRIFSNREEVNKICLMEGRMPEGEGEIAIDRMYADNNEIRVGDTLESGSLSWEVTGLVAFSDYSCLFSDNDDSMFDAIKFGVAVVSAEEFSRFNESQYCFSYSWKYDKAPEDELEEKEMAEDLMEVIGENVSLEDYVPQYLNQAIQFTGEDMGSDKAMMIALLYIIIVIMAFVFGITISNTIMKESAVIGTLMASGYTKGELVRHYMTMPVLVTFLGAVIGNLLGYTVFKGVCAGMYYGSYSLPTYVTIWNGEAFFMTTVIPVLLMLIINFTVLQRKLSLSPLKFLRRDLRRKKQKRAFPLHPKLRFFLRFRLRVIFQNMSNYCILFVGIIFANLLLMFGLLFPSILDHYQDEMENNLLSTYQYILKVPLSAVSGNQKIGSLFDMLFFSLSVETENEDAEKFSAYSLKTLEGKYKSEEVLLYGIKKNSEYIPLDVSEGQIYISSAYSDKFGLVEGDVLTLKEAYEDKKYEFTISGIYDYSGALAIFMNQEELNQTFDLDSDYYSGYFSDTEITDINKKYISSIVDLESLTKISRQLDVSMGSMMYLVDGFAVIIFMILIYLLSKIIIEKNAQSISLTKILGYTNGEISRLYIVSTSIVVILCLLISLPIELYVMKLLFQLIMMSSISGWIPFYVDPMIYAKMLLIGIGTYSVVAVMEYRKIQKVPMGEALKNVE